VLDEALDDELELGSLHMRTPTIPVAAEQAYRGRDVLVYDFGIDGEGGCEDCRRIVDEIGR
jgi:hypothetical protein